MKRLALLIVAMLMASSISAGQSLVVPRAQDGTPLVGDGYGGSSATVVTDTSGAENVIFAGKGVVFGVLLSSGAVTSYAVLSDSGAVTSPTGDVTGQIAYGNTAVSNLSFPMGIRVTDGATLRITGAGGETATVFYLDEEP